MKTLSRHKSKLGGKVFRLEVDSRITTVVGGKSRRIVIRRVGSLEEPAMLDNHTYCGQYGTAERMTTASMG